MQLYHRVKPYIQDERIRNLAGFIGPIAMGTVNMIVTILHFSWLTFNYGLFSYVIAACKALLQRLDRRGARRGLYLAGAASFLVLLIPMTVAMVKTILEKGAPQYPFYWMIYLYALYGTVKFALAVRGRHIARVRGSICQGVIAWLQLICAAYTVQMMEFALIATFDTGENNSMYIMQFLTHGAIILFTVGVIVHLTIKWARR